MARQRDGNLDPLFQHLTLPCVCDYENLCFTENAFLDIPERYGLHWDTAHHPEITGLDSISAPSFLQGWLIFAFLFKACAVFGVELRPSDLLVVSADGKERYISGKELPKYAWLWYGANFAKDWDSQLKILLEFKAYLDVFHRVTNAWIDQTVIQITPAFDRVLLSLVILGDTLTYALSQFPQSETVLKAGLYTWNCPKSLRGALLESGWCRGELDDLFARSRPTVLLHLSTLDRQYLVKDHGGCTDAVCVANQLDEKIYMQAHTDDCDETNCHKVMAPLDEVKNILRSGAIPVVRVSSDESQPKISIEAQPFVLGQDNIKTKYIAISHVWSDGMGNPVENALPVCELLRIQQYVDRLQGENMSTSTQQHHYFWMDTLCVPLETDYRRLAIVRMAKTYFHAAKVLVLDNWLRLDTTQIDPRSILLKVAYSTWGTRLWTYQESILAQQRFIQYGNSAYTMTELQGQMEAHNNLEEVSDCLKTMDKSYLFRNQGAMNLIRAITCPGDEGKKNVTYYASLPPQEDEDEEELRLQALALQIAAARRMKLGEPWQLILDEYGSGTENWYGDDWLRKHIENMNPIIDPIYGHARLAAQALRGNLFGVMVSREDDSRAGEERRLTAFSSPPDILLMDASRGLPGRLTSKFEDETICLGGVIGLDVSPMLNIKLPKSDDPIELRRVREERMKVLLSHVKTFVPSILFWESERLSEYPWRWAPLSFLDRRACVHSYSTARAMITKEGLLGTWDGIRIRATPNTRFEKRFKTLRLQWATPNRLVEGSDAYHYHHSWENLELRHNSANYQPAWADIFSGEYTELGLIVSDQANLEGILVDIVKEDRERTLYAHYLANIGRVKVDEELERLESYVDAVWSRSTWVVG